MNNKIISNLKSQIPTLHKLIDKNLEFAKSEKENDKIIVSKLYKKAIRFFDDLDVSVDHLLLHNVYGTNSITIGTGYVPIRERTSRISKEIKFVITPAGISITIVYGDFVYRDSVTQLQGRSKVKLREKIMEFIFLSL